MYTHIRISNVLLGFFYSLFIAILSEASGKEIEEDFPFAVSLLNALTPGEDQAKTGILEAGLPTQVVRDPTM